MPRRKALDRRAGLPILDACSVFRPRQNPSFSFFTSIQPLHKRHPSNTYSNDDPNMQTNVKMCQIHKLIIPAGCLTRTVMRKTAEVDNTEEHCYVCFEEWQMGDGMVRLRCCDHWLHEDYLSKSVRWPLSHLHNLACFIRRCLGPCRRRFSGRCFKG